MERYNKSSCSESHEEEQNDRYLTFRMDQQLFGIHVTEVVQIIGMQNKITPLPDQQDSIKGLISLRGQIIPVMDARLRFGYPEQSYNERTCIIIMHIQGKDFGLIVDEVDEVIDILPKQISSPPKLNEDNTQSYLAGIAQLPAVTTEHTERIVLLLHTEKLLNIEVLDAVSKQVFELEP